MYISDAKKTPSTYPKPSGMVKIKFLIVFGPFFPPGFGCPLAALPCGTLTNQEIVQQIKR